MNNTKNEPTHRKQSVFYHVLKFLGWWSGFAGLYAMFSVCPFCGQAGCPVGAGTAGVFGGLFAFLIKGKSFLLAVFSRFNRKTGNNYKTSTGKSGGRDV
jgi:hypothetical protein